MSVEFHPDHKTHKVEVNLSILCFGDVTGSKAVVSVRLVGLSHLEHRHHHVVDKQKREMCLFSNQDERRVYMCVYVGTHTCDSPS